MIKLVFVGLLKVVKVVVGAFGAFAHVCFGFIWRAHVVLFRNLVTPRADAMGALIGRPTRRS